MHQTTFRRYSQNPELIDNQWFLTDLIVDNTSVTIPSNSEVTEVILWFPNYNDINLETGVCNGLIGEIEFDNVNSSFSCPLGFNQTLIICDFPENQTFEVKQPTFL